nr:hypothetical protein [Tanacetum cinerariifolium]
MEEYISLKEEKAQKHGKVFNWKLISMYVPFGTPFDPKSYYKDGDCTRMLQRPRSRVCSLAERTQFDIRGLLVYELIIEFFSTFRFGEVVLDLDMVGEEMQTVGFGLYLAESARQIPEKGDLSAYWIQISLIACSIVGRSQVFKVFYLGRKQGAMISGGQFVTRLAEHFGLLTEERLVDGNCARPPCYRYGRVAGPAWTMAQRLAREKEDVHEIRGALGKQREILDSMADDFSRFPTWIVVGLSQMMSQDGVRYTSYADFQILCERHNRCRTDGASISTAQQDEQQPDR